jgi:hypothetical protein
MQYNDQEKGEKGQTMNYKALHKKLSNANLYKNTVVKSGGTKE